MLKIKILSNESFKSLFYAFPNFTNRVPIGRSKDFNFSMILLVEYFADILS
jgi:hypothetical protein